MLIGTSKFFKENKIARTRWASAICSLWKIYKSLLPQIAEKSCSYLLVMYTKEDVTESQDRRSFESVSAPFVIFHSRLWECTRSSQSEARIFFMYIIIYDRGQSFVFAMATPCIIYVLFYSLLLQKLISVEAENLIKALHF